MQTNCRRCAWTRIGLAAIAASLVHMGSIAPAHAAPPGTGWRLVFEDNFDNWQPNKWSKGWAAWQGSTLLLDTKTRYDAYYDPANIRSIWGSQANSYVRQIITEKVNTYVSWENRTYNYKTASIHTMDPSYTSRGFRFKYGYAEIRCFPMHAQGMINDFWMLNDDNPSRWPPEVDIVEFDSRVGKAFFYNHYRDSSGNHRYPSLTANINSNAYHTFGCLWEPGSLKWYVDGTYIGQITTAVPAEDMILLVSSEVRNAAQANNETVWPKYFTFDYVRVWQR
jgi:hypothetical protein